MVPIWIWNWLPEEVRGAWEVDVLLFWSFIYLKKNFNGRVIVLQCCVGFYHTTTWISHKSMLIVLRGGLTFWWGGCGESWIYGQFKALIFLCDRDKNFWSIIHQQPLLPSLLSYNIIHSLTQPLEDKSWFMWFGNPTGRCKLDGWEMCRSILSLR